MIYQNWRIIKMEDKHIEFIKEALEMIEKALNVGITKGNQEELWQKNSIG